MADRRHFLSRTALAFALPTTLSACLGQDTTPVATSYRSAVQRVLAEYFIPGALVSVRRPGDAEWKEAFGYADVTAQMPIAPDTHFPIRSITKSFTVTALLKLAADHLDTPIAPWFPEIPNAATITFADLASMHSGIGDYSGSPGFLAVFGSDFSHVFREQDLVDFALPLSPVFDPEAQYQYCNTNTVLLGMFVEQLTSGTLAAALQRLIFDPLELTGTAYPDTVPIPPPAATPYEVNIATGALERRSRATRPGCAHPAHCFQ